MVHHAQLWTPLNNCFNFSVCVHGCACSDVHVKARGQPYGLQSTLLPLLLWTKFKSIWISQQPPRPALSSASLEAVFPSLSVIVRSWPALLLQPTLCSSFTANTLVQIFKIDFLIRLTLTPVPPPGLFLEAGSKIYWNSVRGSYSHSSQDLEKGEGTELGILEKQRYGTHL